MKIEVYWNLHKEMFSVRHKGKVIAHVACINVKDAKFVVQKAGRERVLREKKKNVHAFIRGTAAVLASITNAGTAAVPRMNA